jgi:hypothetical protein
LKNIIAIVGDWGGNNCMKNVKSSLGKGMKKIFKKYFNKVLLIDETNTSKLNHITHKEMSNLVLELNSIKKPEKEPKIIHKRMHEILMYKTDKKSILCPKYGDEKELKETTKVNNKETQIIQIRRFIHRDKNAVLNFKYLLNYYCEHKKRPELFTIKKTQCQKVRLTG